MAKIIKNGHLGHSGHSEVSKYGLNGFPMSKNLGIDIKIKTLVLAKAKLQIGSFSGIFGFLYLNEIGGRAT